MRVSLPTHAKASVILGIVLGLISCTTTTDPTLTSSYGPRVRTHFLTGTNPVKIGISQYLGTGTFSAVAEFHHVGLDDVNPTTYTSLEKATNHVIGYSWWSGSAWSSWVVDYNTTHLLSSNALYKVYLSGEWVNLSNSLGTIQLVTE